MKASWSSSVLPSRFSPNQGKNERKTTSPAGSAERTAITNHHTETQYERASAKGDQQVENIDSRTVRRGGRQCPCGGALGRKSRCRTGAHRHPAGKGNGRYGSGRGGRMPENPRLISAR